MRLPTFLLFAVILASASRAFAQTAEIPTRQDNNLIVAAYNIQWVGQKWHDYEKLAEVIQHFDVCGLIEVKSEKSLQDLAKVLKEKTGKEWGFVYGVRTHLPPSTYHEAFGVLWRRDRVQLSGLVGGVWDYEEAFRNDPYIVSFRRGNFDFAMLLVHTRWDSGSTVNRAKEVKMIAEQVNWMQSFLDERDFLVAGDFNYKGTHDHMKPLSEKAGLVQLDDDPKSTYRTDGTGFSSSYDHIYVLEVETSEYVSGSSNTLHTAKVAYGNDDPDTMKKARSKLSDHLPVFAVFKVDGEDDD